MKFIEQYPPVEKRIVLLIDESVGVHFELNDIFRKNSLEKDYYEYISLVETNAPKEFLELIPNWGSYHADLVLEINNNGYEARMLSKPYEVLFC